MFGGGRIFLDTVYIKIENKSNMVNLVTMSWFCIPCNKHYKTVFLQVLATSYTGRMQTWRHCVKFQTADFLIFTVQGGANGSCFTQTVINRCSLIC